MPVDTATTEAAADRLGAAAYAVAARHVARRLDAGATRVGRKIGLTSEAVQRQLGVGTPDFGARLDDMVAADGVVAPGVLLQPKIEAEVAFLLSRDLDGALETVDDVRPAVAGAMTSEGLGRARLGDPLRAGEVVLSGALGPMAVVRAGDVVEAEISGLGPVRVTFAKEELDGK